MQFISGLEICVGMHSEWNSILIVADENVLVECRSVVAIGGGE